jgi:hypothetical protein
MALGQVFSECFSFPCQVSFHQLLHTQLASSSRAGSVSAIMAGVPSVFSLFAPHELKKNLA